MRTSEEIYHWVRWDPRFDPARFTFGVSRREGGIKRVALAAFVPGGDIPWHRVMFVEADEEVVWDRASGVDRIDATGAGRVASVRRLRAPSLRACVPHRWEAAAKAWRPAPEPSADLSAETVGSTGSVRVLTWNTLWDRYDAERIDTPRRRPLLLEALRSADADVIALQEVEAPLLAMLAREAWIREAYTLWTNPDESEVDDDGLVLLSRLPVLESGRCVLGPYKAALAMVVAGPAGPLALATTHLTSNHSEGAADRRAAELALLATAFGGVDSDLVVMGDFNDSATGPEGPAAALGLRDAWSEAHGDEDATPTFDPTVNPLAAVSSLTGQAGRLDRILLRARSSGSQTTAATLLGDAPDASGLYPSDHFGIRADLAFSNVDEAATARAAVGAGAGAGRIEFAPPTARTALAWIPPRNLWPAINELRERHDPQAARWMPHVNVLFGFVPEHEFERAAPLLAKAAAQLEPFPVRLEGVATFGHRDDATIWLDPAAADTEPWAALHREFQQRFPSHRGRAEGYTPHLTLGRSNDPQRVAALCAARLSSSPAMSARVGSLALLSRRGDEPMRVRAEIELGTGNVHWLPEACPEPPAAELEQSASGQAADRIVETIRSALVPGVVHVVGSRRMGCQLPGADVDLVAALPGTVDPREIQARLAAALPEATRIRQVVGARVPGLRMTVGALEVDLVIVATGELDPTEVVERRAELGEAAAIALSAVGDSDAVLRAVGAGHAGFVTLARQVKAWAAARGLDSAPFGGLPGIAWSVLAARTAAGGVASLARFFEDWAAWDWRTPVALDPAAACSSERVVRDRAASSSDAVALDSVAARSGGRVPSDGQGDGIPSSSEPVSILTPSFPIRSCTTQVGAGMRDLLVEEFFRGWEITQNAASPDEALRRLCEPPPLHRRHAAWAVVSVAAGSEAGLDEVLGRTRGRMRALISRLEEISPAPTDVHAWPRPWVADARQVGYVIGLGRMPPDRRALADVAERWGKGAGGVNVEWVEGGAVESPARFGMFERVLSGYGCLVVSPSV